MLILVAFAVVLATEQVITDKVAESVIRWRLELLDLTPATFQPVLDIFLVRQGLMLFASLPIGGQFGW